MTHVANEIRDKFESWMATGNYPEITAVALEKLPSGEYKSQNTFAAWQAWQAAFRELSTAPASGKGDARVAEQWIEEVARLIYELDPYYEAGESVEGHIVSPGGYLSWEQAKAYDAEFADEKLLIPITKLPYGAARIAHAAMLCDPPYPPQSPSLAEEVGRLRAALKLFAYEAEILEGFDGDTQLIVCDDNGDDVELAIVVDDLRDAAKALSTSPPPTQEQMPKMMWLCACGVSGEKPFEHECKLKTPAPPPTQERDSK